MKKIIVAEAASVILSIVFIIIFQLLIRDLPAVFSATFFAIALVVFGIISATDTTTLSTSLLIFTGSLLVANMNILLVLAVTTPMIPSFITIAIVLIVELTLTFATFALHDLAGIKKNTVIVAASLLVEAVLVIAGSTFVAL